MNSEHYLAVGLAPSLLPLLEPSASSVSAGIDWGSPSGASTVTGTYDQATGNLTDIQTTPHAPSDAVQRIQRTTADACARWFRVVRAALGRERDRQQKFRVEHGLPKSARLPYQKPLVERSECATWQAAEATLRCLYGDEVADYARTKFLRAIETGDMRAFKIRLLVLKARDSLTGTSLLPDFIAGIEDCISTSEEIAGCTPDPSPRRLSRAEQERKRKREALIARKKEQQPELNLGWPEESTHATEHVKEDENQPIQDIEHETNANDTHIQSPLDEASTQSTQAPQNSISCKTGSDEKNISQINFNKKSNISNEKTKISPVTVTDNKSVTVTNKKRPRHSALVRKTKNYETADEILADIEAGLIVPYESAEEICADVQAGILTEAEALLFILALDRYNPLADTRVNSASELEIGRASVEDDDGDQDDDLFDEDEEDVVEKSEGGRRPAISYNPLGFGGCGGSYSDGGMDWNPDED